MGLFGSSKPPQPPLPNLAIHLSTSPDTVFRPDDLVNGYIEFTPVVPIAPHAIEVSLFGQAHIWHRTSHSNGNNSTDYYHWRDNAPLFETALNVLPNSASKPPTLEVGQTYTYPFHFQIPLGTGNSRVGQYKQDDDPRWTIGPHKLPPTFRHDNGRGIEEQANYAKIEYGVRATLMCPGIGIYQGKNLKNLVVTTPIIFVPLTPDLDSVQDLSSASRRSKICVLQNSALTSQTPTSIGFRQSMRDRFSSQTPKLDFEISLELPDLLITGSEFRFRAVFRVRSKSDNVTHIPAIYFAIAKMGLQNITQIRAPRDMDASTFHSGHHRNNKYETMPPPDAPFKRYEREFYFKEKTFLNSLPQCATLELEEVPCYEEKKGMEQASSCEAWFIARVPGTTPPSFQSFAISRTYRIKIGLLVEIGGKKFEHEVTHDVREMGSAPT